MEKITGFLRFTRELPQKRSARRRIKDYREFIERFSVEKLSQQASRCMDCGVPFCHNGCPLGNIIPEFNEAVYRKDWKTAYEILSDTNNFPEFTGRICPAPCESACVLGINQPPVTIEEIERHIIEIAFEQGIVKAQKSSLRTGHKVAIIGSGPAGLAAAAQLNRAGHSVRVFERDKAPGGLLRYGIPDFKLEKWVVDRRIALMEEEGVTFQCHAHVGVNVPVDNLLAKYQAIVLATGTTAPRDLAIAGRQLKGIHFAMEYLKQQNKRNAQEDPHAWPEIESNISEEELIATDKHVVVIGGGDTGSDCVGTAHRQKARSVTQLELMFMPPKARTALMPWPTHPMLFKTTSSHEEGGKRHWAIATKAFIGDAQGRLKAIQTVDIEWEINTEGRPIRFIEVPGSQRELPCDLVLLAMGFLRPHPMLMNQIGVRLDERGLIDASERLFETNLPKVFACGDARRGQSLVVWAISEGRECARKVDEFLMGAKNPLPQARKSFSL